MRIVPATSEHIAHAAALIRSGQVLAFPTETVYGLGADATNADAVARVFAVKDRPSFDPLIVHIAAAETLARLVTMVPDPVGRLTHRFWPGPLTVVLPKSLVIPDIVTAGLPAVAVRMPDHPVALELIEQAACPIAAPSANRFGHVSPTTAQHVLEQLVDRIPLVLDGGPCRVGLESTIVSFVDQEPLLLRPGGLTLEDIESVIGPIRIAAAGEGPLAPGRIARHYAPRTPLTVINSPGEVSPEHRTRAALLLIQPLPDAASRAHGTRPQQHTSTKGFAHIELLAAAGRLERAAAALFASMRQLDAGRFERIYAVAIPERGLGRAIMDRLRRAQEDVCP
jgi:L-threonylcarbamoyladenylate synthase